MLRTYKTYNTITLEYFLNKNFDAIFFIKFFKLLKIRLKIRLKMAEKRDRYLDY